MDALLAEALRGPLSDNLDAFDEAILELVCRSLRDAVSGRRRTPRKELCKLAARRGYLAVLQWARKNNCPWDEETSFKAASGGHIPVLEWLRGTNCPWLSNGMPL